MKIKKLLSIGLASIMTASVLLFTGCKKDNNQDSSSGLMPENTVSDRLDRGTLDNTLHKVNVTPSSRVFVENLNTKNATTRHSKLRHRRNISFSVAKTCLPHAISQCPRMN